MKRAMVVSTRHVVGVFLIMLTAGCAAAQLPDHPNWSRPLCEPGIRAVATAHDAELRRVFDAVAAVARPDLPVARYTDVPAVSLSVVAVEWAMHDRLAAFCQRGSLASVLVNAGQLAAMLRDDGAPLARILGHELAHLTLGHERLMTWATADAAIELEADELGTFYAERAGFSCRRSTDWAVHGWAVHQWPDPARYRAAVAAACAAAERGQRPVPRFAR